MQVHAITNSRSEVTGVTVRLDDLEAFAVGQGYRAELDALASRVREAISNPHLSRIASGCTTECFTDDDVAVAGI